MIVVGYQPVHYYREMPTLMMSTSELDEIVNESESPSDFSRRLRALAHENGVAHNTVTDGNVPRVATHEHGVQHQVVVLHGRQPKRKSGMKILHRRAVPGGCVMVVAVQMIG